MELDYKFREYEKEELLPVLESIGIDGVIFSHNRPGVNHERIQKIKSQYEDLRRKMDLIQFYLKYGCSKCGKSMEMIGRLSEDKELYQCQNCMACKVVGCD